MKKPPKGAEENKSYLNSFKPVFSMYHDEESDERSSRPLLVFIAVILVIAVGGYFLFNNFLSPFLEIKVPEGLPGESIKISLVVLVIAEMTAFISTFN